MITDEGLRQIALSPCAAEHLAVLELDNCPNISDNGLNHLMQACHNLERIELYDCLHITREGIRKLRVFVPFYSYSPHVRALRGKRIPAADFPRSVIFSARRVAYHATGYAQTIDRAFRKKGTRNYNPASRLAAGYN